MQGEGVAGAVEEKGLGGTPGAVEGVVVKTGTAGVLQLVAEEDVEETRLVQQDTLQEIQLALAGPTSLGRKAKDGVCAEEVEPLGQVVGVGVKQDALVR